MNYLLRRLGAHWPPAPALWVGLLLSLAVGTMFYLVTLELVERDARSRFAAYAQTAGYSIGARIKSYNDVLRGAVSLFHSRYPVTAREFHEYVRSLDLRNGYPGIATINLMVHVDDSDRKHAEQEWERDHGSKLNVFPPGRRPSYGLLTLIEPPGRTSGMTGYDLYADPRTRALLERARDSGDLSNSGVPIQALTVPSIVGLGIRRPIYRPGMPLDTVLQRRAAYVGSVGITFLVNELVKGVIDEMPIRHVRLHLVDNSVAADGASDRVLFDSTAGHHKGTPQPDDEMFATTVGADFNGRQWAATFSTEKGYMLTGFERAAPWLAMLAGFVSTLLLYALYESLALSRRHAVKLAERMMGELQHSHEKLRSLVAHAERVREDERKRIAREIHDDLGQNLLALRIEADVFRHRTSACHPRLHARVCATLRQIDGTIKSVRQIINDLRPNVLDLGLSAAIEWQIAQFERRTGIKCKFNDHCREVVQDDMCATALFRVLQESLSNVARHAGASLVQIDLTPLEHGLSLSVSDNGIGIARTERNKADSFGLVGIEERVALLGGTFSLNSMEGEGTILTVMVPTARPPARGCGTVPPAHQSQLA